MEVAAAFAPGPGTMVGWKRIVATVGEKIGKSHLTYGRGASAELMAIATILGADHLGPPVSTTHIPSPGVAGTMAANHAGPQQETLRNILLARVPTRPVCVLHTGRGGSRSGCCWCLMCWACTEAGSGEAEK